MADGDVSLLVPRLTGHLQALDWHDASMARACQDTGESLSNLCGMCAGGLAGDLSHWDQAAARLDHYVVAARSMLEILVGTYGDLERAAALARALQRPSQEPARVRVLSLAQRVTGAVESGATHVAAVGAATESARARLAEGQAAAATAHAYMDRMAGDSHPTASPANPADQYLTTVAEHLAEAERWQQQAHLVVTNAEDGIAELVRELELIAAAGEGGVGAGNQTGRGEAAGPGGAQDAGRAASRRRERAAEAEPAVSADINAIASATGGRRAGEEFVLKSQESLARKIADDAMYLGVSHDEAGAGVHDALRYTITYPPETYTAQVHSTLAQLGLRGYSIERVKNTWQPGSAYKGVNVTLRTAGGEPFELQFHTPDSFSVKMATHADYELFRTSQDAAEKTSANERMVAKSATLVPPAGVETIG